MRVPPSFLEDIRGRVSISSVVGRKVAWDRKKSNPGKGDFWACCPFHGEKSPSFHVDDRKGRYHCFGCKASGDIFTFLVEKEGLSFPEAIERLAGEAKLTIPSEGQVQLAEGPLPVEQISRQVRQNIIDVLRVEEVHWSGRLGEIEFLQRLFDLTTLPSTDERFQDAAGDIWQHRINNPDDWSDDWIFSDKRFNLLSGPADVFLKFVCEVLHPVVRPEHGEAKKLAGYFNEVLRVEGWQLVEEERIAGRPRFVARKIGALGGVVTRARSVAAALEAGQMQKEIERLEQSVERDPALAIGTAKDLVETCCKTILSRRNVGYEKSADLPELTKLLTKSLKLVPEDISDEAKGAETIRLILRNLAALTKYLAELRGLYGSGHGRDGKHRGLEVRHARLAASLAIAFIDFVAETDRKRGS